MLRCLRIHEADRKGEYGGTDGEMAVVCFLIDSQHDREPDKADMEVDLCKLGGGLGGPVWDYKKEGEGHINFCQAAKQIILLFHQVLEEGFRRRAVIFCPSGSCGKAERLVREAEDAIPCLMHGLKYRRYVPGYLESVWIQDAREAFCRKEGHQAKSRVYWHKMLLENGHVHTRRQSTLFQLT